MQASARKQIRIVGKGLELQRIAAGVIKEHRGLFAHLALEPYMWFNAEMNARRLYAFGQGFPLRHFQNNAEMRDGDVMAIDGVMR